MEKFVAGVSFIVILFTAFVFFGTIGGFATDMIGFGDTLVRIVICLIVGAVSVKVFKYAMNSMFYHQKHGYPKRLRKRNRRVA